jgi:hypothetical protein
MLNVKRFTAAQTFLLLAGFGLAVCAGEKSQQWTVSRDDSGQSVRLTVDQPIPYRNAQPVLIINGKEVPASVSQDRRTITGHLDTGYTDTIQKVEQGWHGDVQSRAAMQNQSIRQTRGLKHTFSMPMRRQLAPAGGYVPDPLQPGSYKVDTFEYGNGDPVVEVPHTGIKVERTAAVYMPVDAPGKRPVVVFAHGMHASCVGGGSWPCASGASIPSYRGYSMAAQALASQGYVVVSISANGINFYDDGKLQSAYGSGFEARAWLILEHLDYLQKGNDGGIPELAKLAGKLDMDNIGLMGHSRGGEAVARVVHMNASRPKPFGIRAVLPLAPTAADLRTAIPDVPLLSVLPFCDGDVIPLSGQAYVDDSRYAFKDNALRSAVMVMGANHNYFNEIWSPSHPELGGVDDAIYNDFIRNDPVCGVRGQARLDELTQRKLGSAYMDAFFRLTLGNEQSFLPLFDGSGALPGFNNVEVRVAALSPNDHRRDIARFNAMEPQPVFFRKGLLDVSSCNASTCPYTGMVRAGMVRAPNDLAFDSAKLHIGWINPEASLEIPLKPEAFDASAFKWLSFRLMPGEPQQGELFSPRELLITLTDNMGRRASSRLSNYSDALYPFVYPTLPTLWLQSVQIPLSEFAGLDLKNLRTVELQSGSATPMDVYLSDLAFTGPSTGVGRVTTLPAIAPPKAAFLNQQAVKLSVTLSSASSEPVVVRLSNGAFGPTDLTVQPGARCASTSVPLQGKINPSDLGIDVSYTRNAFASEGVSLLTKTDKPDC